LVFINIHTHLQNSSNLSIVNIDDINSQSVSKVQGYVSVGLHPWHLKSENLTEQLATVNTIAQNNNVLAIGECGLDKLCSTNWLLQTEAFLHQLNLAETLGLPLLIHCVRAHNHILAIKKKTKNNIPWVFHGFNQNQTLAKALVTNQAYLSLGKAVLQKNSNAQWACKNTAIKNLFLETDMAQESIEDIYESAAKIRNISVASLAQQIEDNFNSVFTKYRQTAV
jgi:TatD DNase family protein